jgi:hypothetical protein
MNGDDGDDDDDDEHSDLDCCTVHVVSISPLLFQFMHFTTL